MRKILLAILVIAVFAFSRTAGLIQGSREFQLKTHNVNQVELVISNYGMFGQDEVGAACWWPVGSQENYIYGAGSWFGTVERATGDTLVTIGYGPHGGEQEYVPGLASEDGPFFLAELERTLGIYLEEIKCTSLK